MRFITRWIWKIYFIFYFFVVLADTSAFFSGKSPVKTYYEFLIAFDIGFLIPYSLNVLSILLNAASLVPFYGFITRTNLFSPVFCRWLFAIRLAVDLTGRSYDFNFIKSLFYQSHKTALLWLGALIVLNIPSYIALYLYGFRRAGRKTS